MKFFIIGYVLSYIVASIFSFNTKIDYNKSLKVNSVTRNNEKDNCNFVLEQQNIKPKSNFELINVPCNKYEIGQELEITQIKKRTKYE
jgi:hypothetical protein